MKLLVANLGNRNIRYKGEFLSAKTFKSETANLLNNIKAEKPFLSANIINFAIEQLKNEGVVIDQVIMLASNQESDHDFQDTVYAAQILEIILGDQFGIPVSYKVFSANVADINAVTAAYRQYFKTIRNKLDCNEISKVIYLDAGGTPQQKFASKILFEYLFEPEQIAFYYADPEPDGSSHLRASEPREYRMIIDKENIASAIRVNGYRAALQTLHNSGILNEMPYLAKLLQFMDYRYQNTADRARKKCLEIMNEKKIRDIDFIKNYYFQHKSTESGQPLGSQYAAFEQVMSKADFSAICELYAIAQRHVQIKNYSQACLFFALFVENYLYAVIRYKLGIDLTANNYEQEVDRLKYVMESEYKNEVLRFYPMINISKNVPTNIKVSWIICDIDVHRKMIHSFMEVNYLYNDAMSLLFRWIYSHPDDLTELMHHFAFLADDPCTTALEAFNKISDRYNRFMNNKSHPGSNAIIEEVNRFIKSKYPERGPSVVYLDSLRNAYAHKAKSVDEKWLNFNYYKQIQGWGDLLGMPEQNIYEQMNEQFISLLK